MIRLVKPTIHTIRTRFRSDLAPAGASMQPQSLTLNHQDPLIKPATFQALKTSPNHPPHAGIVILSDICGIRTEATIQQAQTFSQQGFTCLLPDLFMGHPHPFPISTYTPAQREAWRDEFAFPYDRAIDAANSCWEHLTREEGVGSVGVVGYCYGGGRVVDVLSNSKEGRFSAGVAFYGTRIDPALVRTMKTPVLLVFGEKDPLVEMSLIEKIRGELGEGRVVVYEGRGHAFVHRPEEEDVEDGKEAVQMGIEWLKKYLGTNDDRQD